MTAFKVVQAKVQKGWSVGRTLLAYMSVWGLIFSLVTIGGLKAAFDYDDTLVFSTPAFHRAFQSGSVPFSPQFWTVVNQSYDMEKPKRLTNALAWVLRVFGFHITILASRPAEGGAGLRKEWRHLASRFIFATSSGMKRQELSQSGYVLYFGDSDTDIREGRAAHVLALRVRRSPKSSYKEDYHPGAFNELVLPLTEY